jgi:hypothetical protein
LHVIETGSLRLEPQIAAHAEEMFVVLRDPAIYEPQDLRSLRLLERLGFSPASAEQESKHQVEARELLMHREFL